MDRKASLRHQQWLVNAVSYTTGNLTSTGIQFRITPNYCGGIENSYLGWTMTNTSSVNPITFSPSPLQIDHIDVCCNGTNEIRQTVYGEQLYQYIEHYEINDLDVLLAGNRQNLSPADLKTPSAIPASGVATYRVPLFGCLLNQLNPAELTGDINVYVYFLPDCVVSGVTPTSYTMSNPQLILFAPKTGGRTHSNGEELKFLFGVQANYSTVINASTAATATLNGLNQDAAYMCFYNRVAVAASGNGRASMVPLGSSNLALEDSASFDFQDSSGTTLIGTPITCGVARQELADSSSNGLLSTYQPIYTLPFSKRLVSAIKGMVGPEAGHLRLDGADRLVMNPSASFSNGTYVTTVTVPEFRRVIFRDGLIVSP